MGETKDELTVVGNVFRLSDTHGLPLETILDFFESRGIVIDWIEYYHDCINAGWKDKTIIQKIEYPLQDVYGHKHSDEVMQRLKEYMNGLSSNG